MAKSTAQSRGMFPNTAGTDDNAGLLTTTFRSVLGLQYAVNAQLNCVADFATEDDEVIIQIERNGVISNLTYNFLDFQPAGQYNFIPGAYRLAAYTRGFGITGARIGLSSTATNIQADFSAVC